MDEAMPDETTEFIVADSAIDALSPRRRRRRWFRRPKAERTLTHCENCQAPLVGPYCAQCGQHAIDYRRSLMQVMIDAADSFFDWDTKFLRSLGVLLIRPGRLTNDFNAGRRVRYMHPLRLYFLASIAFFLMAKLINLAPSSGPPIQLSVEDRAAIDAALVELTGPDSVLNPEQRAKIAEARSRFTLPDTSLGTKEREKVGKILSRLPRYAGKRDLKPKDAVRLDALLARLPGATPSPEAEPEENPSAGELAPSPPNASPTPAVSASPGGFFLKFDGNEKEGEFGKWLEGRVKEKVGEDGTKGQLFLDTLRSNIPTMMLFCVPIFAMILKILYVFQRRYYIEHLVYALNIHAFAYMAAVVITLIGMGALRVMPGIQPLLVFVLSLIATAQVFVSIRRVYGQGWFFTTFKFFLGAVVYLVVLSIGIGATAFITLLLPS